MPHASRNLLIDPPSLSELARILSRRPARPLCPPFGDPFWQNLRSRPDLAPWWSDLAPFASKARELPVPELTAAHYAIFHATGDRTEFDSRYFERRLRLAHVAISALLDGPRSPWLTEVWRHWTAILEEPAWALPAHTFTPSGCDPEIIDLMCAETLNLCAELLELFGSVAPYGIVQSARARVARLLDVYTGENGESRWGWFRSANNWNAVCHQGVVGAALAIESDPSRLAGILLRSARNLPAFIAGFSADGGCSEGVGYWAYGFGRFAWLDERLRHRSGGELSLLAGHDHALRLVPFGAKMSLHAHGLVNFSDNQPVGLVDPALLSLLAGVAGDIDSATVSKENYEALLSSPPPGHGFPPSRHHFVRPGGPDHSSRRLDVFHYTRLLRFLPPPSSTPASAPRPALPSPCLYPELGVAVAHGRDSSGRLWSFAAKGGHNNEHHNHNDCGSFIYRHDGITWAAEIGAPLYTKDFFHGDRYRHLAARSLGHSVPVVNGHEQSAGRDHAAGPLAFSSDSARTFAEMTLAACYPVEAGAASILRRLQVLADSGALVVTDIASLSFGHAFETALITLATATPAGGGPEDGFLLELDGASARVVPLPGTRADRIEVHSYVDDEKRARVVHRLVFNALLPASRCEIGYRLSPGPAP